MFEFSCRLAHDFFVSFDSVGSTSQLAEPILGRQCKSVPSGWSEICSRETNEEVLSEVRANAIPTLIYCWPFQTRTKCPESPTIPHPMAGSGCKASIDSKRVFKGVSMFIMFDFLKNSNTLAGEELLSWGLPAS
jgi:hypothetical protein